MFVRHRCPLLQQEVHPPLMPCWGSIIVMFVVKFNAGSCQGAVRFALPGTAHARQWSHFSLEQGTSPDIAPCLSKCGAPSCGQQDHTAASTLKKENHKTPCCTQSLLHAEPAGRKGVLIKHTWQALVTLLNRGLEGTRRPWIDEDCYVDFLALKLKKHKRPYFHKISGQLFLSEMHLFKITL